jgi:hypothetical protein
MADCRPDRKASKDPKGSQALAILGGVVVVVLAVLLSVVVMAWIGG